MIIRGSIATCLAFVGSVMLPAAADDDRAPRPAAADTARSVADTPAAAPDVAYGTVQPLETEQVASGLSLPLYVVAPPGDFDRLFIVEQRAGTTGRIKILDLNSGTVNATPFLSITGLATNNEQGLLGLAFHPDYANNGFFYVNYNPTNGDTVVERYQVSGDPDIADANSGRPVIIIDQPQSNHNGGWIDFGPDGFLYIGMGDGGNFNDQGTGHSAGGNAQDITNNLLGKMLRLDVDGDDFPLDEDANYAIPPDNPFVGISGDDEIWAYGLRNPWRCAFDRATGDLYMGDVGQFSWEEVSFQPASSTGGENYGWRCMEAEHCTGLSGCTCNAPDLVLPIHEYGHGEGCSITGGNVYRGSAIPTLQGTYFFADFCSNTIWSFRYDGNTVTEFTDRTAELDPPGGDTIVSITSFGEDAAGEMYICERNGAVYRIKPGPVPPPANDECGGALLIGAGDTSYSNVAATTGGFGEAGCPTFENDVWFKHVVECEGTLTVSVCDASYDTVLAVYLGCPGSPDQALACNDDFCGSGSEVSVSVVPGLYQIRVGSVGEAQGDGTLNITCTPVAPCDADFDGSGAVDIVDLLDLLAAWGSNDPLYDIAPDGGDGTVDIQDLLELLANWGPCT
ncbi:MAG: PQQ-dependent sugar dehydrogenase [Planctomycetota bacterium]|jgi:glucose/arabinose dehydrogenase